MYDSGAQLVEVTFIGDCDLMTKNVTGTVEAKDCTGRILCKGTCKNNEADGNDMYFHDAQGVYTGGMAKGVRDGQGRLVCNNGNVYEGSWSNDVKEGQGVMRYADGQEFEGVWKNGQRGDCVLRATDGFSRRVVAGIIQK